MHQHIRNLKMQKLRQIKRHRKRDQKPHLRNRIDPPERNHQGGHQNDEDIHPEIDHHTVAEPLTRQPLRLLQPDIDLRNHTRKKPRARTDLAAPCFVFVSEIKVKRYRKAEDSDNRKGNVNHADTEKKDREKEQTIL